MHGLSTADLWDVNSLAVCSGACQVRDPRDILVMIAMGFGKRTEEVVLGRNLPRSGCAVMPTFRYP